MNGFPGVKGPGYVPGGIIVSPNEPISSEDSNDFRKTSHPASVRRVSPVGYDDVGIWYLLKSLSADPPSWSYVGWMLICHVFLTRFPPVWWHSYHDSNDPMILPTYLEHIVSDIEPCINFHQILHNSHTRGSAGTVWPENAWLMWREFLGILLCLYIHITLPETNSSHLKIDIWKNTLLLGLGLFSGANLRPASPQISFMTTELNHCRHQFAMLCPCAHSKELIQHQDLIHFLRRKEHQSRSTIYNHASTAISLRSS